MGNFLLDQFDARLGFEIEPGDSQGLEADIVGAPHVVAHDKTLDEPPLGRDLLHIVSSQLFGERERTGRPVEPRAEILDLGALEGVLEAREWMVRQRIRADKLRGRHDEFVGFIVRRRVSCPARRVQVRLCGEASVRRLLNAVCGRVEMPCRLEEVFGSKLVRIEELQAKGSMDFRALVDR